jgi:hypothetical protein
LPKVFGHFSKDLHELRLLLFEEVDFRILAKLESVDKTGVFDESHPVESLKLECGFEAKSLGLFQFREGADVMKQKLSFLPSQNLVVRQEQIFFVRLPHELC